MILPKKVTTSPSPSLDSIASAYHRTGYRLVTDWSFFENLIEKQAIVKNQGMKILWVDFYNFHTRRIKCKGYTSKISCKVEEMRPCLPGSETKVY